jgi:hypothetical protein
MNAEQPSVGRCMMIIIANCLSSLLYVIDLLIQNVKLLLCLNIRFEIHCALSESRRVHVRRLLVVDWFGFFFDLLLYPLRKLKMFGHHSPSKKSFIYLTTTLIYEERWWDQVLYILQLINNRSL